MATIPVDIRNAPLGDALAAIYEAVQSILPRIEALENTVADLTPALDRLEAASATILTLVSTDVPALRAALEAERATTAALTQAALDTAAAEDAEDVDQNAALAEQVAARDAAVAETDEALTRIEGVSTTLEAAAQPQQPEEPVQP